MKLASLIRGNDRGAATMRLLLSAALVAISGGAGLSVFANPASAASHAYICDFRAANSNPYGLISPDNSGQLSGHLDHTGPVWYDGIKDDLPQGEHWGDIIPPDPTVVGLENGYNWTTFGQDIWAAGCNAVHPDLRIVKTSTGDGVVNGTGSYYLNVSNIGNAVAIGTPAAPLVVKDTMPTGVVATSASGLGWVCDISAGGGSLTCERSTDLLKGTAAGQVTVNVNWVTTGSKANTATVDAALGETSLADNTSTITTAVTLPVLRPDVVVAKSGPGSVVTGSTGVEYTVNVSNAASATAATGSFTLTDTVPAGSSVTSAAGTGWACDIAVSPLSCTHASLAPGAAAQPLTVTLSFVGAATGATANVAEVATLTDELVTSNNTSTVPVTVTAVPVLRPDVVVAKSGPGSVVTGSTGVQYTVNVSNAASATAPTGAFTLTDTVPAGSSVTSAAGTGWACDIAVSPLSCTHASLAPGAAAQPLTVTLSFVGAATGATSNVAEVATLTDELVTSNNTSTVPVTVTAVPVLRPDVVVAKSGPGSVVTGSTGVQYTVNVSNAASATAPTGAFALTDTVPAGSSVTSAAGTGWACDIAVPPLSCTHASLAPGAAAQPLTVTLSFVGAATGATSNVAEVATLTDELVTGNNTSAVPVTVTPVLRPDVVVVKAGPGSVVTGSTGVQYTVNVSNDSAATAATGLFTLTDTIPAGSSATSAAGTGWTCDIAVSPLSCTHASLAPGAAAQPLTVTLSFVGAATGATSNVAEVATLTDELVTSNNTSTVPVTVTPVPRPDLSVTKTGPASVVSGTAGHVYEITISNIATGVSAGSSGPVVVTDALPAGSTATGASGVGWTCSSATGSSVVCSHAALLPGQTTAPLAVTATVTAAGGSTLTNTASVPAAPNETALGNNSGTATTNVTVAPTPDLKLTKTGPATRTTGDTGSYSLLVENVGTAAATADVMVTDTLPNGVSVAAGTYSGFTCTVVTNVVTCTTSADLAVGASTTLVLPATFTSAGIKANTATATTPGDGNPANDTSTASTSVTDPQGPPPPPPPPPALLADLSVKKTGPASVAPGGTATWVLTVTNKGPGNAAGFSVTDTLPAGVSLTSVSGPDFTCTAATVVCTYDSVLLPGQSAVVTVVGAVAQDVVGGSVANVVVVGPADATPADNTDTLVSVIDRPAAPGQADLVLEKTAPAAASAPGQAITWTITVTNAGSADASGFTVGDPLSLGLTLVQASGDGFSCTGSTVQCVFTGPLQPGQVATLLVTATLVDGYSSSSVTNTATALLEGDPTPDNNTDTATSPVNLPIGGVVEEPATGEQPTEQPTEEPTEQPTQQPTPAPTAAAPIQGVEEQPATAPTRPRALPFTGTSADTLLALGSLLSVLGLLIALVGRSRRTA